MKDSRVSPGNYWAIKEEKEMAQELATLSIRQETKARLEALAKKRGVAVETLLEELIADAAGAWAQWISRSLRNSGARVVVEYRQK